MKKIFLFIALGLGLCACSDESNNDLNVDEHGVIVSIEYVEVPEDAYLFNDSI